jgi:hypothetical protein
MIEEPVSLRGKENRSVAASCQSLVVSDDQLPHDLTPRQSFSICADPGIP